MTAFKRSQAKYDERRHRLQPPNPPTLMGS